MTDTWYTFPTTMGEDQAWITYNHGYSEVAESDPRNFHLRIRIPFKDPTEYGMPANDEFPALNALDEELDEKITNIGGIYVGRITVDGHRHFYYYLSASEDQTQKIINDITNLSSYTLEYIYESDEEKKSYWDELYPTSDDWQVIQDLQVLDSLADNGDISEKEREVTHWAYFPSEEDGIEFSNWIAGQGYTVTHKGKDTESNEFLVMYTHIGTMGLYDITHHTIKFNRMAREFNGNYDGWETSVERN